MIEVIAQGPVTVVENTRINRRDGHDGIRGSVTVEDSTNVTVDLEFPQGYVNLEGYAPSYVDWPVKEIFGRYVGEGMADDAHNLRFDKREWSVEMRGDWWDWVQQAHRYLTERPHQSIVSCLRLFQRWDETDSDNIERAISRCEAEVPLSTVDMGDMTGDEWDALRVNLNRMMEQSRPDGIFTRCKESYRPEETA